MAITCYKRLGKTKEEFRSILYNLYWVKKLSKLSIAKEMECDPSAIDRYFKKWEIPVRSISESCRNTKKRSCSITEDQMSILNGLMLSDFHIEGGVFQARLAFGFKYKEFAELCMKELSCFEWSELRQDKKWNCWFSKTKYYEDLFDLRKKWYPYGKKIVPKDIEINPLSLMFWYLGDGRREHRGCGATLCCESFSPEENLWLSSKLKDFEIKNHVTPSNRIRISGSEGLNKMIDKIGICPAKCYQYKF